MVRLGVLAALPAEARTLFAGAPRPPAVVELPGGSLLGVSGVGPERARECASRLVAGGVRALVSWGTAGGLDPALIPGTLLVPDRVVDADGVVHAVDDDLRERILASLDDRTRPASGAVVESAVVLKTPDAKAELRARTGAAAVDMESGAVAREARRAGVPLLVVRVVLDSADASIPASALAAVDENGRLRPGGLLRCLLRRPWEVLDLVRLDRGFRAARRTLERVAGEAGGELGL